MLLFYCATIIVLFGLSAVVWLLYSEKKKAAENLAEAEEISAPTKKREETAAQVLNRLGLGGKKHSEEEIAPPKQGLTALFSKFMPRKESVEEFQPHLPNQSLGTASIRTSHEHIPSMEPPVQQEKKWPAHVEATLELSELKEKHQRLEKLHTEKLDALEKSEKTLEGELRNRKEFNKVKDLYEKEIKDNKVRARDLQIELTNAQAETSGFKGRVSQLETKITKLEKNILELEHAVQDKDFKITGLEKTVKDLESRPKPEPKKEEPPAAAVVEPPPPAQPEPEPLPPAPEPPPPAPAEPEPLQPAAQVPEPLPPIAEVQTTPELAPEPTPETTPEAALPVVEKGPQQGLKDLLKKLEEPAVMSQPPAEANVPLPEIPLEKGAEGEPEEASEPPKLKLLPDILENETTETPENPENKPQV